MERYATQTVTTFYCDASLRSLFAGHDSLIEGKNMPELSWSNPANVKPGTGSAKVKVFTLI